MSDVRSGNEKDPLIDEVRSVREKISESCDHDVDSLVEMLRRVEDQHRDRLIVPPPARSADQGR